MAKHPPEEKPLTAMVLLLTVRLSRGDERQVLSKNTVERIQRYIVNSTVYYSVLLFIHLYRDNNSVLTNWG